MVVKRLDNGINKYFSKVSTYDARVNSMQKQPFPGIPEKSCSEKLNRELHREIAGIESFFKPPKFLRAAIL